MSNRGINELKLALILNQQFRIKDLKLIYNQNIIRFKL